MQLNYFDSDDEKSRKRRGRKGDDDSDSSDDSDDGDRTKRRGRRPVARQSIKGFNNAEIRRFIKSYKKFGHPQERFVVPRAPSVAVRSILQCVKPVVIHITVGFDSQYEPF